MKKIAIVVIAVAALLMAPAAPVQADPNLVGLWHFDGDASDSSVYGNDGTVTGATYVAGMFDEALSFDGNDANVVVADDNSLDITGVLTIEAWIRREAATGNYAETIVSKRIANTDTCNYQLYLRTSNGKVRFYNGAFEFEFDYIPPDETWVYLALTISGGTAELYADGISVDTQAAGLGATNDGQLWIGYFDHATDDEPFYGIIDEVRIWDVNLTADEIWDSYSLGFIEFTKELVDYNYPGMIGDPCLDDPCVPINTVVDFNMVIDVNNVSDVNMGCVTVKDRLGAELEFDEGLADLTATQGTPSFTTTSDGKPKNRSAKVFIDWDVGTIVDGNTASLEIEANTDLNPGGKGKPNNGGKNNRKQEYTSPDIYELNSGATLKFCVDIAGEEILLVLTTDPISVTAYGTDD